MIDIFLIILILIIMYLLFNKFDNFMNENTNDVSQYDDVFTNDDQRNCSIFGCSSIRSQNDNYIKYIGDDKNNNKIFK